MTNCYKDLLIIYFNKAVPLWSKISSGLNWTSYRINGSKAISWVHVLSSGAYHNDTHIQSGSADPKYTSNYEIFLRPTVN